MDDDRLLAVLVEAAAAVRAALDDLDDWGPAGTRAGQYRCDLAADAAALEVLHRAKLAVLSEESGRTGGQRPVLVVLDPVDGSTNAALGLPWYATSLCALDDDGPRVALVVNQASGVTYDARRGGGARRDGRTIAPSSCRRLDEAVVGISGLPAHDPGWAQFRALGSAALDHCAVAEGSLDGYVVVGGSRLHGWDYLGGRLVCTEAGASVGEREGADPVVRDASFRSPVAACGPELLASLLAAGA